MGQFKSCLWKQNLSYWRSPSYNLIRFMHTVASSFIFGILFWKQGKKLWVIYAFVHCLFSWMWKGLVPFHFNSQSIRRLTSMCNFLSSFLFVFEEKTNRIYSIFSVQCTLLLSSLALTTAHQSFLMYQWRELSCTEKGLLGCILHGLIQLHRYISVTRSTVSILMVKLLFYKLKRDEALYSEVFW